MNDQIKQLLFNLSTETLMLGNIMSIVLGVILILVGFFVKQKKKEHTWWVVLVLLGVVTVVSKIVQLICF